VALTLKQAIDQAVLKEDADAAGVVARILRKKGLSYEESFRYVRRFYPNFDIAVWDALLYESDSAESR